MSRKAPKKQDVLSGEGVSSAERDVKQVLLRKKDPPQRFDIFQVTDRSKKKVSCRACTYSTQQKWAEHPSKARQRMSSHKRECDMENKFQDTASSKKKLRCEISKTRQRMNSHNRKCDTCLFHIVTRQVGMKDNEFNCKVGQAGLQQ